MDEKKITDDQKPEMPTAFEWLILCMFVISGLGFIFWVYGIFVYVGLNPTG